MPSNVDASFRDIQPEQPSSGHLPTGSFMSVDSEIIQHYEDCYWENFDPLFPILHRPTYMPAYNTTLLGAMVLAIGSQFSSRPQAKAHSAAWFAFASRKCASVSLPLHYQFFTTKSKSLTWRHSSAATRSHLNRASSSSSTWRFTVLEA